MSYEEMYGMVFSHVADAMEDVLKLSLSGPLEPGDAENRLNSIANAATKGILFDLGYL